MILVSIGIIIFLLGFITFQNNINADNIHALNNRIDGLHERIDTLRDFIMQRIENDYQRLNK